MRRSSTPEYARFGGGKRILPRGGPDRVRFCIWYSNALDEGKTHDEALEHAAGTMRLLYAYAEAGLLKPGSVEGGIPVEHLGED